MSDEAQLDIKGDGLSASSVSSMLTESTTKRKNVSIACFGCRRGKAKCEGTQPCARCVEKRLECQYPSDGRDRTLLKRKLEQVEHEKDLLSHLISSLRDAQDAQVAKIVSLIRGGATLDEIHAQLMRMSQDARTQHREVSPEISFMLKTTEVAISETRSRETVGKGHDRLRVRNLVDQPPFQVSAASWTDITTDDHLASHLVSLWAAWTHPWPDGIVLDLFLRDMRAGDRGCLFCSPSLVEIILAMGCILSDYPEARTQQNRHSAMVDIAIDRFEVYLSKEEGLLPKISTIQAAMLLHVLLGCIGRDRRAAQCLLQGAQLCNELLRDRQKVLKSRPDEKSRQEASYVIDVLGWHMLGLSNKISIGLMHPQPMRMPARPFPLNRPPITSVRATGASTYARIGQTLDTSLEESLPHHAELAVLEHELLDIRAHVPTKTAHPYDHKLDTLLDLDARLVLWHERLPHHFKEPTRLAIPIAFLTPCWRVCPFRMIQQSCDPVRSDCRCWNRMMDGRNLDSGWYLTDFSRCATISSNSGAVACGSLHEPAFRLVHTHRSDQDNMHLDRDPPRTCRYLDRHDVPKLTPTNSKCSSGLFPAFLHPYRPHSAAP